MLTNNSINDLIGYQKSITSKKFNPQKEGKYYRKNIEIGCDDLHEGFFSIFIRQHIEFVGNFSIGLLYHYGGKKINLVRLNGSVTQHEAIHHRQPHLHFLTEDDINNGRESAPSNRLGNLNLVSFKDAISYFSTKVNIDNYREYFNRFFELDLFE